ncbi:16S rRNA (adenine(1518)-N(6)/adenine(1519)-N(6))-dimethyltransferase RsmA [Methylophilaceae bacterium]|jgi:16S rRNA (adenine1518-N6/adenine1519-N6)-dimethyltransferase|nr:16S rRNA (adenine(1518)-N(6)/adenine(1519)-N(6))-dimethyltransferase RsmA [Methylophilaceae bacterium]
MIKAKKKFGQNFLTDYQIIKFIIDEIKFSEKSKYLEIGPGMGALTIELQQKTKNLSLIEIDPDMIKILRAKLNENTQLFEGDVLSFDDDFFEVYNVVLGNLPYYISTEIIFRLIPIKNIDTLYFMVQKEVADRLVAKKGSKDNSVLTNLIGFNFRAEKCFDIDPKSFNPAPKVTSSFIKLTRHSDYINDIKYIDFKRIIKESFKFKRKNLKNNLKDILKQSDFENLKILPTSRAEDLTIEDFIKITKYVITNA